LIFGDCHLLPRVSVRLLLDAGRTMMLQKTALAQFGP
jgi:hypothetical protein